jgi:drug/metabolite transporter (DMT)-like permease
MLAILGGLGAAVAFATATLCSSRSTRMVGAAPVLGWVMVVGLVAVLPLLLLGPGPGSLDRATLGWLTLGGVGNAGGLLLAYRALSLGQVGVVAPIVSTEGAITAVIALLAGESLSVAAGATLAVIAGGIVLSTAGGDDAGDAGARPGAVDRGDARRAALCAIGAAVTFGVSLYATGRVSGDLPTGWVILPARLAGVVAVALPLLIARRLTLTRRAAPLVVAAGLCELLGFASFTLGAAHGIAIAAVLQSQFAAIAAVAAFVLFGERLARVQVAGVAAIVSGVAVLSLLQA